jgi:hypothetical protein
MTPERRAELKRLADAAASPDGRWFDGASNDPILQFIAAANPQAILDLIAWGEEMERRLSEYTDVSSRWREFAKKGS